MSVQHRKATGAGGPQFHQLHKVWILYTEGRVSRQVRLPRREGQKDKAGAVCPDVQGRGRHLTHLTHSVQRPLS